MSVFSGKTFPESPTVGKLAAMSQWACSAVIGKLPEWIEYELSLVRPVCLFTALLIRGRAAFLPNLFFR